MGFFSAEPPYDRKRILEAASRARARKRRRKAVALYRRVLAVEPSNVEIHSRLAPLLAATGQHFDAWASFELCARAALTEKNLHQAASVYREATQCLPREFRAWEGLARVERQRARLPQAWEALREGRGRFRGRRRRAEAIALLRRSLELEPGHVATTLDLCRQLARSGQESEALMHLERLAAQATGRDLRRVRGVQWRVTPTLVHTWRWIHAACTAGRDGGGLGRSQRPA